MNQEAHIGTMTPAQEKVQKRFLSPFFFKGLLASQVPLAGVAGVKVFRLDTQVCETGLPFRYLTKNPFRSIYFAAQSMAAELSTAAPVLMAIEGAKPSIALIVTNLEAEFHRKATGYTRFTCEEVPKAMEAAEACKQSGEAVKVRLKTVGRLEDGTEVATFWFTWSLKQRSK